MRLFAVAGLIALAAVLAAPTAAVATAAPSVTLSAASKPAGLLNGLSCISAKNCVAVGQDLTTYGPLVETWNGTRWAATALPMPGGDDPSSLFGVSCATARSCLAVGIYSFSISAALSWGALLAESWNGRSWTRTRLPDLSGVDRYELSSVSCTTAGDCVATGLYELAGGRTAGFAELLSDGKWKAYELPGLVSSAHNSAINHVSCMSAVSCVAVGSIGNSTTPDGSPANAAVAEFWDGRNWSEATLATPAGSKGAWLYGLSCTRSKTCIAVGGRRLANGKITPLAETWSAATGRWRAAFPAAAGSEPDLGGVSCVSAGNCLAVGGGDEPTAATNSFSDSWNGKTWKYEQFPAPLGGGREASDGVQVSCLTAAQCVAIADDYIGAPAGITAIYGISAFWNGKAWRLVPVA
jgi:hypothetical protein